MLKQKANKTGQKANKTAIFQPVFDKRLNKNQAKPSEIGEKANKKRTNLTKPPHLWYC